MVHLQLFCRHGINECAGGSGSSPHRNRPRQHATNRKNRSMRGKCSPDTLQRARGKCCFDLFPAVFGVKVYGVRPYLLRRRDSFEHMYGNIGSILYLWFWPLTSAETVRTHTHTHTHRDRLVVHRYGGVLLQRRRDTTHFLRRSSNSASISSAKRRGPSLHSCSVPPSVTCYCLSNTYVLPLRIHPHHRRRKRAAACSTCRPANVARPNLSGFAARIIAFHRWRTFVASTQSEIHRPRYLPDRHPAVLYPPPVQPARMAHRLLPSPLSA